MDVDVAGSAISIFSCFFVLTMFALVTFSLYWVFTDSERRGKTGCMWLLIAFFTWPWGVLAYYVLRDREVKL
jgi:hypothetical protein